MSSGILAALIVFAAGASGQVEDDRFTQQVNPAWPQAEAEPEQPERTAEDVQALVATMTDPAASVEDRWAAEDELQLCHAKLVLPALLEHVDKGMPEGGIWNSGGRERDRNVPVEWQSHFAVHRAWDHATSYPRDNAMSGFLLDLIPDVTTNGAKLKCIQSAGWSTETDQRLVDLALDPDIWWRLRRAAAGNVVPNNDGLYEIGLYYARTASTPEERHSWIEFSWLSYPKRRHGIDPRAIQMALDAMHQNDNDNDSWIVSGLARYVGPNPPTEYRDEEQHLSLDKARIEAEAAEWDARPKARGTRDAFRDLQAGKLIIQTWGRPQVWEQDARKMMSEQLGFTYVGNFCSVPQETLDYNSAYNRIMESAIRRKHGPDWQAKVDAIRTEAKERFMSELGRE